MRTTLRGKVTLLFMTLGLVLAIPAVALADGLEADADDLVAATPHGNNASADQQPGTTVYYDFSAQIKNTGNVNNDVFPGIVNVSIARAGDWLSSSAGTPNSFNFSAYDSPQAGEIGVTVPCNANTTAGSADSKTMTATLTAGTSTNGKTLSPDKQTLSYTITASGGPAASCAPANTPPTANAGGLYTFDEGSDTNALSGSGTDPDGTIASYAWDLNYDGTNFDVDSTDQNPNFDATNIDGPATRTVTLRVTDSGGLSDTDSATVTINNVAPTVSSVSASSQNALVNKNVTFTGTATDPSSADTAAKFFWQWSTDGTNYSPILPSPFLVPNTYSNEYTTSFADCGSKSVSAKATDKDLGTSLPKTSSSVNVYNASFSPPVDAAPYLNTVQKGRVIPVKISVSCNGNIANLLPSIQLLTGDKTDGSETTADEIETYSVSSADSTGVMRAADGGYIYNLRVPDVANAYYTVRVNPFGGSNASSNMYALLKTRK
jgi:hypothetical protein